MILSTWVFEYALQHDIFSLLETSNEFIHASFLSKIHFHRSGPLKLIKF